jgi:hypothetical protein
MANDSLRNVLLDAVINGEFGNGIVVSVSELKATFGGGEYSENYLNTFLANSEMGALTAGYRRFTIRVDDGVYQIHPVELLYRMRDRGLV